MKAALISIDLILAMPILSIALLLLFGTFSSVQSDTYNLIKSQQEILSIYQKSQIIVVSLSQSGFNRTEIESSMAYFSRIYSLNITLSNINQTSLDNCSQTNICRIATISDFSYLLSFKNG